MKFSIGERVVIKTREATDDDMLSQLYYNYFGGLRGVIVKEPEENHFAISVDRDSLPSDILKRHKEIEKLERDRWLAGISEEQKRNMTAQQKQYTFDYTVLVDANDLEKEII